MALKHKRVQKKDTIIISGINWRRKAGFKVWNGEYMHPKYDSPILCTIEASGVETYRWSFTTPGPDIVTEAGVTEGMAHWYAADDVRAAINKL